MDRALVFKSTQMITTEELERFSMSDCRVCHVTGFLCLRKWAVGVNLLTSKMITRWYPWEPISDYTVSSTEKCQMTMYSV